MNEQPRYVATINTPGYLPMDDNPPVFDTAREAWEYLATERGYAEDDAPGGVDYSDTWHTLQALGTGEAEGDQPGTVYGPTPGHDGDHDLGLAYTVSVAEGGD